MRDGEKRNEFEECSKEVEERRTRADKQKKTGEIVSEETRNTYSFIHSFIRENQLCMALLWGRTQDKRGKKRGKDGGYPVWT